MPVTRYLASNFVPAYKFILDLIEHYNLDKAGPTYRRQRASGQNAGAPEITPEMLEAGAAALASHYGEAGEPKLFLRRAVEDVYLAMAAVVHRS